MPPLLLFPAFLFISSVASRPDFFSDVGKEVKDDINLVKQPVEETVVDAVFKKCEEVKKLIGVNYDQLDGTEKEPDVNNLTLEFRTETVRTIYNITSISIDLPQTRNFRYDKKIALFLHGFTDNPTKDSFGTIADSLLEHGGYNVMALDGSSLIKWLYLRSSTYVRFMGEKVGATLAGLVKNGQNPDDILIIGHSLGAHIAGFTGKTFRNITGKKLGRISGLDPAGPCFSDMEADLRLNKNDAKYVDVIHTNAGVLGLDENIGHADYWPNGGDTQPDCTSASCSHSRVWQLYAESVKDPLLFPARKCKDWDTFKENKCANTTDISYMGLPSEGRGVFYLRTGEKEQYGLGVSGLKYDKSEDSIGEKVVDKVKKPLKTVFG